jgi:hypothetical protein
MTGNCPSIAKSVRLVSPNILEVIMLLARKGYTMVGQMLMPIEDTEFSPADANGIEFVDGSGPAAFSDELMYDGSLRDEDNVASVSDRMFSDDRYASYNAYSEGSGTEVESVWVDDMLMNIVKLIDDRKTRYYHAKLLNVYYDRKREKLATGSVRFTEYAGRPAFYCVRSDCKCAHTMVGFMGDAMDFLHLGAAFGRPYGERVLSDPYLKA